MYSLYRHAKHVAFSISCFDKALFARFLFIGQQRSIQFLSVFQYGLSPHSVPHSLVDEFGYLLMGDKSELMKRFGSDGESVPKPNGLLVDTNQLLNHIVWPTSGAVVDIAKQLQGMTHKLCGEKYQGVTIFVIFD